MPARRKPTGWEKAEKIGPDSEMQRVSLAGMPKPGAGLWQTLTVAKEGMPEIQELLKYLPLKQVGDMPALPYKDSTAKLMEWLKQLK